MAESEVKAWAAIVVKADTQNGEHVIEDVRGDQAVRYRESELFTTPDLGVAMLMDLIARKYPDESLEALFGLEREDAVDG